MLENVPSLDRFFAQSGLRQYETVARRLWRDHAYSDVPVPGPVIRFAMTPIAAGVKGHDIDYETSFARRRANSASVIDPAFFSRSSFSFSSAALKPTTRRSSSRAC